MKKKNKIIRNTIIGIILIIILFITINAVNIWRYTKVDETKKADVIIVLGAAAYNTGPSPVYRERLNHAAKLFNNGYSDKIIVTGGYVDGNQYSDAYIGKEYLLENGIPDKNIIMEEESVITEENLVNAKVIMDQNGYDTALIVSDPIHMKRAMYLCERCDLLGYSSPTQTTMYKSWNTKLEFLAREVFYYSVYLIIDIFI